MRIVMGADHAGYQLKERLKENLIELGHEVVDKGTNSIESVDYPDYAAEVCTDIYEEWWLWHTHLWNWYWYEHNCQ